VFPGYIRVICWMCGGYFLDMFLICVVYLVDVSGYILGIRWLLLVGLFLDIFLLCFGKLAGMCRIYF